MLMVNFIAGALEAPVSKKRAEEHRCFRNLSFSVTLVDSSR